MDYLTNLWSTPNYDCWEENGDKVHTSTLCCIYGGLEFISRYIKREGLLDTVSQIKEYILKNCSLNGRLAKHAGSDNIDASLLWAAVPFNIFNLKSSIIVSTVKKIEDRLLYKCGVHRYPEDTYYGGGLWLLLSCSPGWYYAETGERKKAGEILNWVGSKANSEGEMPEQVLDHVNSPEYIKQWRDRWGEIALPLLWSHAMYLILLDKLEEK